jgi:hypothetical protein
MIRVNFTTFEFDAESKEWVELPIALLLAKDEDVTISGPHADWINPDLAIVDPETAERITLADGAERWARLLPFAYRNGDLSVEVTQVAVAEPVGASFHYSAARRPAVAG